MIQQRFIQNRIKYIGKKISESPLLKGVLIIGSGNALAQLIGLVATPIITRLYTPSDLGTLAVYSSVLSILVVMASFRYEFAYPLPKEDKKAVNLLVLSTLLLISSSIILFLIILLMGPWFTTIFNLKALDKYLWLLIIGYFGSGFYSLLNSWAIRNREYRKLTHTKVSQSILGNLSKIFMGILAIGPLGLIIGQIISQSAGIGTLLKGMIPKYQHLLKETSLSEMKHVAKEYKSFPLFSLPASILNMIALQVPTIMLSSIYGVQVVGWYALANGLLVLPSSVISLSLSQVYLGESAKLFREDSLELNSFYLKTIKSLFAVSLPLIIIPALLAPWIFPIIFGEEWKVAGYYCIPLSIMVISAFVASSTSKLGLYGYNNWQLIWDLTRTSFILIEFYISSWMSFPVLLTLTIYSITMSVMYIILILLNIKAISNLAKKIKDKY